MYLRIDEQRIHATARSAIGGETFSPKCIADASRRLTYDPYAAGDGQQNVPRVFAHRLPADMAHVHSISEAQMIFVRIMLPVVLRANEIITLQRSMLRAETNETLLSEAMWQYGASSAEQLDRRFDAFAPSLLIALAAAHSDWGRNMSGAGQLFPSAIPAPSDVAPDVIRAAGGLRRTHHTDLLGPTLDALHGLNTSTGGAALRRERARQRRRRRQDGYRLALLLDGVAGLPARTVHDTLYAIEAGALTRLDEARLAAPCAVFH
ncbi:MAG: hypothetical protein ACMVY4_00475 [Minwuia sp.]|uniref:hypothetical protein n=1 Tax=Minwuia sp. TaxID=2493630 RepID=UPI003A88335C